MDLVESNGAGSGKGMNRIWMLQRELRRGRLANSIGVALFFVLLAVLLISVFKGVRDLPVS
jgi:hypothetical protein